MWVTFLALADKDGIVEGSVPGLADMARLTVDEARTAIDILSSPDPDSRSKESEGRRILPIDGGWLLVNHSRYRELLSLEERREYLRIKQAEHRAKRQQMSTLDATGGEASTLSTHAEAAPEASSDADHTPLTPFAPAVPNKSLLQLRVEALFHRRPKTPWDGSELRAWAKNKGAIEATPEEDLKLLEWFYSLPQAQTYARKNLATLLNNWNGEIDRAKNHQGQKPPVNIHDPKQYEKF